MRVCIFHSNEEDCNYHGTKCSNAFFPLHFYRWNPMRFKYSPFRKVPSAPGANNHRHLSGNFSICCLPIIFRVVIVITTGTTHFTGQAVVNNDGDLLCDWVGDPHSRCPFNDYSFPWYLDRYFTCHFAGNRHFPAIYLDNTKKGKEEEKQNKNKSNDIDNWKKLLINLITKKFMLFKHFSPRSLAGCSQWRWCPWRTHTQCQQREIDCSAWHPQLHGTTA